MCTNPRSPLLLTLVNTLRDETLTPFTFRHTLKEIAKILLNEALKDTAVGVKKIRTWSGEREVEAIDESRIMVVSVMRAALPMHEALLETLTDATSGFLAMKRDETTHESTLYYDRVGDCTGKTVIIVDPMVATGGSLCDAIDVAKGKGAARIKTLNIVASPEGIAEVIKHHPEVQIYIAQIDEKLDENKYILPGLGDAGDRAYNTL
ncbi:MAG: uracil phosphoribosyltransferase [Campylobacterales bacterium]|nr:uracil phosphoribosyltransferase [Campylobacterales bacterium]